MLNRLVIKNVALIDCAEINFSDGLNVLSGETGSGKSVILESLNFVLGAKADKSLIRSGEKECWVVAEFNVENNADIYSVFDELDFEKEDILIISRKFTIEGKNVIKINGNTATVSMLKRFTSYLVDVHGQSEHFYLLKTSHQLDLLDKVGGNEISIVKEKVKTCYCEYKNIIAELNKLGGDESQRAIRLDILDFQIKEIEAVEIKENEENELNEIKSKLLNQEKISNALTCIKNSVNTEGGIGDILGNTEKIVSGIAGLGEEYSELYDRIYSIRSEIEDIADTASGLIDNLDYGEYNLDYIENRLDVIKNIKKKYGNDIQEINLFLENAKKEKDNLEHFNERAETLLREKGDVGKKLYSLYKSLSEKRKAVADEFGKNILSELEELNIDKAQFFVKFNVLPDFNECNFDSGNGVDSVEFMFSANLGEPVKPLSEVISGGEMSRFMLAIKTQTAKHNNISTFVFDEIDAGISGKVAKTVAEKFAKISTENQVIAISHLPQISAMADNNLLIFKTENGIKTVTRIKKLDEADKIAEIIRLVGGSDSSESAKKHAEEIIDTAEKYKSSLKKLD